MQNCVNLQSFQQNNSTKMIIIIIILFYLIIIICYNNLYIFGYYKNVFLLCEISNLSISNKVKEIFAIVLGTNQVIAYFTLYNHVILKCYGLLKRLLYKHTVLMVIKSQICNGLFLIFPRKFKIKYCLNWKNFKI